MDMRLKEDWKIDLKNNVVIHSSGVKFTLHNGLIYDIANIPRGLKSTEISVISKEAERVYREAKA